jgi:hypothetical protein
MDGDFHGGFGHVEDARKARHQAQRLTKRRRPGWPQKPQIDGDYHPLILWNLCFLWRKFHRLKFVPSLSAKLRCALVTHLKVSGAEIVPTGEICPEGWR